MVHVQSFVDTDMTVESASDRAAPGANYHSLSPKPAHLHVLHSKTSRVSHSHISTNPMEYMEPISTKPNILKYLPQWLIVRLLRGGPASTMSTWVRRLPAPI